jgi:hypothetical protein
MNGDELADDVVVADDQARGLATELQILWDEPDRRHREDLVLIADVGEPVDHRRGADAAVAADRDVLSDDGVRADAGAGTNAGARMHDCRGIHKRTFGGGAVASHQPHDEFRLGNEGVVDVGDAGGAHDPAAALTERDLEAQPVSGSHLPPEFGVIDAAKEDAVAVGSLGAVREQHGGDVCQRLDHEDAGHDWSAGEMPLEEVFVHRDVLDRHHAAAGLVFRHRIDER